MRAVLLVAFLVLAAGCLGPAKPKETTPAPTTSDPYALPEGVDNILRGRITAADQSPLSNATVEVISLQVNQTTGPDGTYQFQNLEPHDYLVVVSKDGYRTKTQRAIVEDGRIFELHFTLDEKPLEAPWNETLQFSGMISCEFAYATNPENVQYSSCSPPGDFNNKQAKDFYVKAGAAQIQVQAAWRKTSEGSKNLAMSLESIGFGHQDVQFGHQHGESGIKMTIGQTLAQKYYASGGSVRVTLKAAPSITGEESALDVGFALQQGFDVYFTIFYIEPGPPTFSALPPQ